MDEKYTLIGKKEDEEYTLVGKKNEDYTPETPTKNNEYTFVGKKNEENFIPIGENEDYNLVGKKDQIPTFSTLRKEPTPWGPDGSFNAAPFLPVEEREKLTKELPLEQAVENPFEVPKEQIKQRIIGESAPQKVPGRWNQKYTFPVIKGSIGEQISNLSDKAQDDLVNILEPKDLEIVAPYLKNKEKVSQKISGVTPENLWVNIATVGGLSYPGVGLRGAVKAATVWGLYDKLVEPQIKRTVGDGAIGQTIDFVAPVAFGVGLGKIKKKIAGKALEKAINLVGKEYVSENTKIGDSFYRAAMELAKAKDPDELYNLYHSIMWDKIPNKKRAVKDFTKAYIDSGQNTNIKQALQWVMQSEEIPWQRLVMNKAFGKMHFKGSDYDPQNLVQAGWELNNKGQTIINEKGHKITKTPVMTFLYHGRSYLKKDYFPSADMPPLDAQIGNFMMENKNLIERYHLAVVGQKTDKGITLQLGVPLETENLEEITKIGKAVGADKIVNSDIPNDTIKFHPQVVDDVALRLKGIIPEDELRKALSQVRARYPYIPPHEKGPVDIFHVSDQDRLGVVDPEKMKYKEGISKTFWGGPGYIPDPKLGTHRYVPINTINWKNLYDFRNDPDSLYDASMKLGDYEQVIKDKGYKGYYIQSMDKGTNIALFDKTPVIPYSKISDKETKPTVWDKYVVKTIEKHITKIPYGENLSKAFDPDYIAQNIHDKEKILKIRKQRAALLSVFDRYTENLSSRLGKIPKEHQGDVWSAINGEKEIFTLPDKYQGLASESKKAIADLGQQLVDLGIMKDVNTYKRNLGKYIHLSYLRHEFIATPSTKGEKIAGNLTREDLSELKHRIDIGKGTVKRIDDVLLKLAHEKDNASSEEEFNKLVGNKRKKIITYLHELYPDESRENLRPVADWILEKEDIHPVNSQADGSRFAERNWRKALVNRGNEIKELEWGLIKNPQYAIQSTLTKMGHDVILGRYFKGLASIPDIARKEPPTGAGMPIHILLGNKPTGYEKWQKLPETSKIGALSGMWVHPDLADEINYSLKVKGRAQQFWEQYLSGWKIGKVLPSWKTHIRNMFTNAILSHMGGFPLWEQPEYYAKAIKEMSQRGKIYRVLSAEGLFNTGYAKQELAKIFMDNWDSNQDFLVNMLHVNKAIESSIRVKKMTQTAIGKLSDIYGEEEDLAKLAHAMYSIDQGKSASEAAQGAEKSLFNYSNVTRFQSWYRSSPLGAPFATFTFKAIPRVVETLVTHPWRLIPLIVLNQTWKEYVMEKKGINPEQYEARKELVPDWANPIGFGKLIGFDMMPLVPFQDKYGRDYVADLSYWTPWGGMFETGNRFFLPQGLTPLSQPLVKDLVENLANEDIFFQRPLVEEWTTAPYKKFSKEWWEAETEPRVKHFLANQLPTPIVDFMKMLQAETGKRDYRGREVSPTAAKLSAFGIKTYPMSYIDNMTRDVTKLDPTKGEYARIIRGRIMSNLQKRQQAEIDRNKATNKAEKLKRTYEIDQYNKDITKELKMLIGLRNQLIMKAQSFQKR